MGTKILRGTHKCYLLLSKIPFIDERSMYIRGVINGKAAKHLPYTNFENS